MRSPFETTSNSDTIIRETLREKVYPFAVISPASQRRQKRRGGRLGDKITSIEFSQFYNRTLSAGLGSISLHPSQFNRTFEIADNFMLYRFVSLDIEAFPVVEYDTTLAGAEAGNTAAIGWVSNVIDALGSQTSITVSNLVHSVGMLTNGVCTASGIAVPYTPQTGSKRLRLDRKALVGETALKWYKATVGTPDTFDEIQGYIICAVDSDATPWWLMIRGVVEFTSPVAPAISPEELAKRMLRKGRALELLRSHDVELAESMIPEERREKYFRKKRAVLAAPEPIRPQSLHCDNKW